MLLTGIIGLGYLSGKQPGPSPTQAGSNPTQSGNTQAGPQLHSSVEDPELLYIAVPPNWPESSGSDSLENHLLEEFQRESGRRVIWLKTGVEQVAALLQNPGIEMILSSRIALELPAGLHPGFSFPWGYSSQQVVSRTDTGYLENLESLTTRQIFVKVSSTALPALSKLAAIHAGMDLVLLPEEMPPETILERVASGQYDLAVLDGLLLESLLPGYQDLNVALNVTEETAQSWGLHARSVEFQDSINRFLSRKQLERHVAGTYREDLTELKSRKVLRLITYENPVNYFFDKGKLKGFEYELAKQFAREHHMRLDVVLCNSMEEMKELLRQGRGDIIAASLPYDEQPQEAGISYSRPYNYSAPVIVGRVYDSPLLDLRDLAGREIVLPPESPYLQSLQGIKDLGINVGLKIAAGDNNMEATLMKVAAGDYDLTVISSHQLRAETAQHANLKAHFVLTDPTPHAWAVRSSDPLLQAAINRFLQREYRMSLYNDLYARYIENPGEHHDENSLLAAYDRLSPYDDIVHKYAEMYDFDWRLIVAQMYQESRFNPVAVSQAGAAGLMQLAPETVALLAIGDPTDPDAGIHGGIRYLDSLRDRFEDEIPGDDKTWFALGAYNAGFNRIEQARDLAEKMQLDRNLWFNNVEQALLVMAKPKQQEGELLRLCRCGQTAYYVREIKTLYSNYVHLTRAFRVAADEGEFKPEI